MNCTRRTFLIAGSVAAAGTLAVTPEAAAVAAAFDPNGARRIYRFSVRGRRASRAAKAFCANMRFKTKDAALKYPPPHGGFNGRLVAVDVSKNEFHRLFVSRHSHVADLRALRNVQITGVR